LGRTAAWWPRAGAFFKLGLPKVPAHAERIHGRHRAPCVPRTRRPNIQRLPLMADRRNHGVCRAWLWRGLQPFETPGYFLYSATLLPTFDYPFYNVGWSLQPEIAFYIIVAAVVPLLGLRGLVAFLLASTLAAHLIDGPWYFTHISRYYGLFLAGVLAFMAHEKLSRFGFWRPAVAGVVLLVLLGYFSDALTPLGLFFVISAFANLAPSEQAWWRKPATKLGDASYSIYLIHPMVFFTASSLVSKFPNAPVWVEEPIRFTCIGIVIALSLLSWRLFETPMIRLGNRLAALRSSRRPVEKLAISK